MSDEEKRLPTGTDGDPGEAEALKDFLNPVAPKSTPPADNNVFAQNLFGAPPPQPAPPKPAPPAQKPAPLPPRPAAPTAPEAPQPQPAAPPPVRQAPPPEQETETEEDIKIVTADFFENMTSQQPAQPEPNGNNFAVKGAPAVEGVVEGSEVSEENLPELAEPHQAAEPAQEEEAVVGDEPVLAELAPSAETWELESPVDESRPIEDAIADSVPAQVGVDGMPLKSDGTPVVLRAAKAKEGAEAIEQAREVIEKLDGLDEGFLDVAEVKRGLKALADLVDHVEKLAARIEVLEGRLK